SIGLSETGPFNVCATASAASPTRHTVRAALPRMERFMDSSCVWLRTSSVAERSISLSHGRIALRRRAVAAAARRAHQDDIAALEHVLLAVVDRDAVDLHVAEPTGLAAREAGRLELRPLGHERREDRRVRLALEADVLPEAAAEAPGAARARAQA